MARRYGSGMNSHTPASLDFQARIPLFGRPHDERPQPPFRGREMNPQQLAFVRHCLALYKAFLRLHINENRRIYHHTPELCGFQPTGHGILEWASACGK